MRFRLPALATAAVALSAIGAEVDRPTFSRDVAPIFYARCVSCHRPGEIAPMSLLDYASARPWAKSIKEVVATRKMPPWHADSSLVRYANDRSLTRAEIATIVRWVDQGAPAGDPADLPAAPRFIEGWAMGEPDLIFHAKRDFTIPANQAEVPYQCIAFHVDLKDDLYISGWEIRPRVPKAFHHANLVRSPQSLEDAPAGGLIARAVLQGGDYIGSYLPGSRPMTYPEAMAYRIPAGSSLAIQVHYVGLEEEATDHLMFGVRFAEGRIDKLVRVVGTDTNAIAIPPGDPNWGLEDEVTILHDLVAMTSGVHMHLRGKDFTMEGILPDGSRKLITAIPRYDFNWQSNYVLAEPIFLPKGTKIHVTAHWDNSDKNPANPDARAWVRYGPWTDDEMLLGWTHVVIADERLGYKIEKGRLVGKFDDAQPHGHPFFLQTLPSSSEFQRSQTAAGAAAAPDRPASP